MILKKLGKGLKVVGGTVLRSVAALVAGCCCTVVGFSTVECLVAGVVLWKASGNKLENTYQQIRDSQEYKVYRQAEDERLEKLYNNTVAEDYIKFQNGEISEARFSVIKGRYDAEVAESNDVSHYLSVTGNTSYDKEFDTAQKLGTAGVALGFAGTLISACIKGLFPELFYGCLGIPGSLLYIYEDIKTTIKGEDDEEEGEEK